MTVHASLLLPFATQERTGDEEERGAAVARVHEGRGPTTFENIDRCCTVPALPDSFSAAILDIGSAVGPAMLR